MKKLLLFVGIITLLSCSSNEEETKTKLEVILNPPAWINGTWYSESIGNNDYGWIFTDGNAIRMNQGSEQVNIKESTTSSLNGRDYLNQQSDFVKEIILDNRYSIEIEYHDPARPSIDHEVLYEFIKISDTEIEWTTAPTSVKPLIMKKQ
ncbi:hypothetical protein [Polaribacter porphyrae]|uniref:Uncharacterized protein n=1 Tax=Polaribacter porphyrae TaxID=1137780 RepID=A0A2S7WT88_9FLAO|nr:hypothetical protein [Polaribacter porphyrae]PQJ80819.1 hypothetical protein BTO18_17290 [Polaribacter porphyrae]